MANRIRRIDEKVQSIIIALGQIGVEDAALDRLVYGLYGLTEEEIE